MLNPIEQFNVETKIYKIESFKNTFSDYKLVYFDSPSLRSPNGHITGGNDFADDKEWYIIGVIDAEDYEVDEDYEDDELFSNDFISPINQEYSEILEDNYNKPYDNLEVLISMLNLGELIYPTWDEYDQKDKSTQLLHTDEIIAWCKIFGLPNTNTYLRDNYVGCKRRNGESNSGFSVYLFKLKIIMLFNKFNIWFGLTYNDINLVKKHAPDLKNTDITESQLMQLKNSIAIMNSPVLNTEYDKKSDTYKIVPYAFDLFTVAHFQLSMLMINKSDKNLYFCDGCGKLFIRTNNKTKNCDICKTYQNSKDVSNYRKRKETFAKQYITEKYKNSDKSPHEILALEKDFIVKNVGSVKDCKFNTINIVKWLNR